MRRSKRQRTITPKALPSLPDYPEGPPNPAHALENIVAALSDATASFKARQLARVDDFVIRMLFEPKYKGKRRKLSDNAKFCQGGVTSSEVALTSCKMWIANSREKRVEDWLEVARDVWEQCVLPFGSVEQARLEESDAACFQKSLVRYGLLYQSESPVQLCAIQFPNQEIFERGVKASRSIPKGEFILQLGGWTSIDEAPTSVSQFSVIRHQGRKKAYAAILAGPIRFCNHSCDSNAAIYPLVDLETLHPLFAYLVQAVKPISQGEEITVNYGKDYFTDGCRCLCESCCPRPAVSNPPGHPEQPNLPERDTCSSHAGTQEVAELSSSSARKRKIRRAKKRLREEDDG